MIKLNQAVIVEGKYDKITLENIIDATICGEYKSENGYENTVVNVSLVCEDGQWRLNSATY